MIAYSKTGYENKIWELPKDWVNVKKVKLSRISMDGKSRSEIIKTKFGKLSLTLAMDEMFLIEKL